MKPSDSKIKFIIIKEKEVPDFPQAVEKALNDGYRFHSDLQVVNDGLVVSMIKEDGNLADELDNDSVEFKRMNFNYALEQLDSQVKDLLEINGVQLCIIHDGSLCIATSSFVKEFTVLGLLNTLKHKPTYVDYDWLNERLEMVKRFA